MRRRATSLGRNPFPAPIIGAFETPRFPELRSRRMNFGFTQEQEMIRDSVRKYAEAELLPNYQRWDRTGEWLTQEFIDKLVATGLLNLRLPPEYGGQGASFVDCGLVCE